MYSYKKHISNAMQEVIDITTKRRKIQEKHNKANNITPTTIFSKIKELTMTKKTSLKLEK